MKNIFANTTNSAVITMNRNFPTFERTFKAMLCTPMATEEFTKHDYENYLSNADEPVVSFDTLVKRNIIKLARKEMLGIPENIACDSRGEKIMSKTAYLKLPEDVRAVLISHYGEIGFKTVYIKHPNSPLCRNYYVIDRDAFERYANDLKIRYKEIVNARIAKKEMELSALRAAL